MAFFQSAVGALETIVVGIGAAVATMGGINFLDGYGNENAGAKSQGIKQIVAGGGIMFIGLTLVPQLSNLFG